MHSGHEGMLFTGKFSKLTYSAKNNVEKLKRPQITIKLYNMLSKIQRLRQ